MQSSPTNVHYYLYYITLFYILLWDMFSYKNERDMHRNINILAPLMINPFKYGIYLNITYKFSSYLRGNLGFL
jgi:hypothetical protein